MTIAGGIKDFLESLEVERNRSLATIRAYRGYLDRFVAFAHKHGVQNPTKITGELMRQYRLHLARLTDKGGASLSKATQAYHLIAIRSFLKYLAKRDIKTLAPEKIDLPRIPQRQVTFLEPDELNRLLEAPTVKIPNSPSSRTLRVHYGADKFSASGGPAVGWQSNSKFEIKNSNVVALRDKAILEMLFSTGMRVSELASLRRDQINLKRDEFTVRGKGAKLRVVFLSPRAKSAITAYINNRNDTSLALFVRHDRAAKEAKSYKLKAKSSSTLTPRSIQRLVEKYAKAAGITKPVHPHTLRHTTATDLLRSGANLKQVQSFLGHASITTTQIYTHVTAEDLREVHKKYHGRTLK